jgi:membrane protein involved in colicin uptake
MKNQKFNPVVVNLVNNQFVLVRNTQVIQSEELGSFATREELADNMRMLGINRAQFSEEAHKVIYAEYQVRRAAKAEARAIAKASKLEAKAIKQAERNAKAEARAIAKASKLEARTAKAEARATAKAAKLEARTAKAEARAQAKAEKLVARQLNKDAKLAAKAERARIKAEAKPKAKASKLEATVGSDGIERVVARRSDELVEELA